MGGGIFGKEFARHKDLADVTGEYADENTSAKKALEEALASDNGVGTLQSDDPNAAVEIARGMIKRGTVEQDRDGMLRATYSNDAVVVARKDTSTPDSSAISISYTKPSGQRAHIKLHLREDPEPYRTRKGRRKKK